MRSPVLLRAAWLDAFDLDAEPEPPHRELGEIEKRIGAGEGHAVVGGMALGRPNSLKTRSKTVKAKASLLVESASQAKR